MEIRPVESPDLAALNGIYNHYVVHSHATFDVEPVSLDQRAEWFRRYVGVGGPYRAFVAVDGGHVVGFASSGPFHDRAAYSTSVTCGVYVTPETARRGAGAALYGALFASLAGEDLHRAYAGIALPNDGSIALHERFGFRQVALYTEVGRKFGRFWDVAWYERPLP